MKKIMFFSSFIAAIIFTTTASAQALKTGVGVRLSSSQAMVNNSITLKHFLNERAAIEALFSFGDPLAIGALYEIHKPFSSEGLQWFYGGGGYLGFVKSWNPNKNKNETDVNVGAQGVLGLDYKFVNLPLNISLDWKPELNLVSDIILNLPLLDFRQDLLSNTYRKLKFNPASFAGFFIALCTCIPLYIRT